MGGYKYPYQEKSSIKLTQKEDRLVNSFVTTRRIPRPPKIMAAAVLAVAPLLILPAAEHLAAAVAVLVNVSSPLKTGSKRTKR